MNRICVIYTGGTIGMVPTGKGYAPKKGSLRGLLEKLPAELPSYDLIEFDPLLDSSNISIEQWNQIGQLIYDKYEDYEGFVILHGTDTMAYTASALSFMLENLNKPVIITGSQIPLSQIRSDGQDNIVTSLLIAAGGNVKEVGLYFGGKLLRGNRATKTSADGLIAFDSPNYPSLAKAGIDIVVNDSLLWKSEDKPLVFHPFGQSNVGVLKLFPGIPFRLYESLVMSELDGIVLEAFGTGNIPSANEEMMNILTGALKVGALIVVCSQCLKGTVRLGTYETSDVLIRAGAVSGYDMTLEACITKLYYLFSKGLSKQDIKQLMEEDLRGELTK